MGRYRRSSGGGTDIAVRSGASPGRERSPGGVSGRPSVCAEGSQERFSRAGARGAAAPAQPGPCREPGVVPSVNPAAAAAAPAPEPPHGCQASVWLQHPLLKYFYSQEIEEMLLNISCNKSQMWFLFTRPTLDCACHLNAALFYPLSNFHLFYLLLFIDSELCLNYE